MGFQDIKQIAMAISDMESAVPEPMPYIVLRHKDFSKTDGDQLFGLYGISVFQGSGVGGGISTEVKVDENKPCTFYRDKRTNVLFAVIPDCKHNRDVLTNPNNVRQILTVQRGDRAALLTIMEAPEDLKAQIEKIRKDIVEKKIDPTPKYAKLPKENDPFNSVPLDTKMPIDGEA
jgi:hypothetical protein